MLLSRKHQQDLLLLQSSVTSIAPPIQLKPSSSLSSGHQNTDNLPNCFLVLLKSTLVTASLWPLKCLSRDGSSYKTRMSRHYRFKNHLCTIKTFYISTSKPSHIFTPHKTGRSKNHCEGNCTTQNTNFTYTIIFYRSKLSRLLLAWILSNCTNPSCIFATRCCHRDSKADCRTDKPYP